jgi:hypothetical protein
MITMTQTFAPADLLGLGGVAVRPCTGIEAAVSPVLLPPVTSVDGIGLPFGGTAIRMRPQARPAGADAGTTAVVNAQTKPRTSAFAHNSIAVANDGTPLGIHPSGRPKS